MRCVDLLSCCCRCSDAVACFIRRCACWLFQSRWDTLRKKFRVATLPITAAKLEAISNVFRCAVTQELITAPAVTPMCCKQNISASQLKACFSKMDASTMCPLCRTDLSGVCAVCLVVWPTLQNCGLCAFSSARSKSAQHCSPSITP